MLVIKNYPPEKVGDITFSETFFRDGYIEEIIEEPDRGEKNMTLLGWQVGSFLISCISS